MADSEKYNFGGVDLNGTHGVVLSHVKTGSRVLECGCAIGYMTKYLKEQMGCQVDVIEKDAECLNKARKYARLGFCGDLDEHVWCDYFVHGKYDYILFADVLEHLRNPTLALSRAARLLDEGGQIIMSIPNVCHNDIILRMVYDQFNYTDMGLLDNTHIHLFGMSNIRQMIVEAGLDVVTSGSICVETGKTEQRLPEGAADEELLALLKKREFGEVYQFVVVCKKA